MGIHAGAKRPFTPLPERQPYVYVGRPSQLFPRHHFIFKRRGFGEILIENQHFAIFNWLFILRQAVCFFGKMNMN
jgi:hypothetical protein